MAQISIPLFNIINPFIAGCSCSPYGSQIIPFATGHGNFPRLLSKSILNASASSVKTGTNKFSFFSGLIISLGAFSVLSDFGAGIIFVSVLFNFFCSSIVFLITLVFCSFCLANCLAASSDFLRTSSSINFLISN